MLREIVFKYLKRPTPVGIDNSSRSEIVDVGISISVIPEGKRAMERDAWRRMREQARDEGLRWTSQRLED